MSDPKINPPIDHLFWAALLLRDRVRVDLVVSVLAVELEQTAPKKTTGYRASLDARARALVSELLDAFKDQQHRNMFEQDLCTLVPEWLTHKVEKGYE